MIYKFISILVLCLCLSLSLSLSLQAKQWQSADHMQMRLISGVASIADFKSFDISVEIRMEEGWHSYWRTPGDSGLPPRFDWSGSENVKDVEISYPAPRRFDEYGLYTFGYKNSVTFPARVSLEEAAKPARLVLKLETMMCKDICIPQTISAGLDIPTGRGEDSGEAVLVKFARDKVPHEGDTKFLAIETAVASRDMFVVSIMAGDKLSADDIPALDIFTEVETEGAMIGLTTPPDIEISEEDSQRAVLKIARPFDVEDMAAFLSGKKVTMTLVHGRRAIEKELQF